MATFLTDIARSIGSSAAHDWAVDCLRNVPGLPPIVQTVHLLSIAVILASIVLVSMRTLGLAIPSQAPAELARRLAPWTWCALPALFASGSMFVLARPQRYFANPVFGIKFLLLIPALALTAILYRQLRASSDRVITRVVAALTLFCWIGVILAGRWIAYADYLFIPE